MTGKPKSRTSVAIKERLLSALLRPVASLPSRIIFGVFATALVTSLVVAWISTQSIESFLRGEIDRKFPAILHGINDRLASWYDQRQIDVETFGQSSVVVENISHLVASGRTRRGALARDELRRYLTYVLERFPQFEALFVLDEAGEPILWVGREVELPAEFRRELAAVSGTRVGEARRLGAELVQVASTPLEMRGPPASLHAFVEIDAVRELLFSDELGASGVIYLVDQNGDGLIGTPGTSVHERFAKPLPPSAEPLVVEEYTRATGEHVVGTAMRFERFGWTLVVEEDYDQAFSPVTVVIRKVLATNLGIVVVFGLIAYGIARSIVRPILALADGVLRTATGETGVVIPGGWRNDEIGALTRAFNEMSARLQRNQAELEEQRFAIEDANRRLVTQNRELQRVNEVFEQLSITDDLTKLHNHRFFQDHLPQEMKRSDRTGEPLSLILIDIDDFKQLNDHYGHAVGDAVLRRVSDLMRGLVRETDLLARYGGEEFALLASTTALEGAVALAEKLRLTVARARFPIVALDGPAQLAITVSIGVARYRGDTRAFFNEADRALYRAKHAGKDCVVVAEEG